MVGRDFATPLSGFAAWEQIAGFLAAAVAAGVANRTTFAIAYAEYLLLHADLLNAFFLNSGTNAQTSANSKLGAWLADYMFTALLFQLRQAWPPKCQYETVDNALGYKELFDDILSELKRLCRERGLQVPNL